MSANDRLKEQEQKRDDHCKRCNRVGFELFRVYFHNGYGEGDNTYEVYVCRDCRAQINGAVIPILASLGPDAQGGKCVDNKMVLALKRVVNAARLAETQWSWNEGNDKWNELDVERIKELRDSLHDLDELAIINPLAQGGKCPKCLGLKKLNYENISTGTLELKDCPTCQGTGAKPPTERPKLQRWSIDREGSCVEDISGYWVRAADVQAHIDKLETTQRPQRGGEGV